MLAVDTNVVVRLLVNDDAAQHQRALVLFRDHTIWLPKTVVLESEWVLRTVFQFEPAEIASALRKLLGLPQVRCEDMLAVTNAVEVLAAGLDFADALHLASSQGAGADEGLASFDARFVKRARKHWPQALLRAP